MTSMSNINLRRFIQDHYKSGVTVRDVAREAITNAIQANASEVTVNLEFSESSQRALPGEEARRVLEKISIIDNGEGFTEANSQYFYEVCTSHKESIGGKGVGRLSYLKFAKKIQISSQLSDKFIEFEYSPDFELSHIKSVDKTGEKKTSIILTDLNSQINTHISTFVNSICEDIRLLLFLKKQKNENFTLNFRHNSEQQFEKLYSYKAQDIVALKQNTFEFESEIFECYLFKDELPKKGIFAMLCADDLRIEEYAISKRFDVCRYSVFISSTYFNSRSNMERQKLEIPLEDKTDDIFTPISRANLMPKIHKECMAIVNEYAVDEIANFKKNNISKLQKFYPYINVKSLNGNAQLLDADQVIKRHRELQAKTEDRLVESLAAGKPLSIDDVTHLASDDLARYIVHRALVIDSLANVPSESAEDEIHKAFLPKNNDGENLYDNNIWLIDDKFLSYSSVFSDVTLNKIVEQVNANFQSSQNRKPDVAAFFTKDDLDKPNKLVIVEFKKPQADIFGNNKALAQCRLYANELVDKIPTVLEVYAFGVVEIDDEFYKDLKQTNYQDIFSPTERILYQSFKIGANNTIILHQYVMPCSALLKDAKARNKVFEDILRLESIN